MGAPKTTQIRGLDVRCDFVTATLVHTYNPSAYSEDDLNDVVYRAYLLGSNDSTMGREDAPILFQDEPALEAAWTSGHQASTLDRKMAAWYDSELDRYEREFEEEHADLGD